MDDKTLKFVKHINMGICMLGVGEHILLPKKAMKAWGIEESRITTLLWVSGGFTSFYCGLDYLLTKETSSETWQTKFTAFGITQCVALAIAFKYKDAYGSNFTTVASVIGVLGLINVYAGLIYKPKDEE
eukprot:390945_1